MEMKLFFTVLAVVAFLSGFSSLWVIDGPRVVILSHANEEQVSSATCGPDRPILVRAYCRRLPGQQ